MPTMVVPRVSYATILKRSAFIFAQLPFMTEKFPTQK
jgi:hypothetical protein